jgi:hypothetical protein
MGTVMRLFYFFEVAADVAAANVLNDQFSRHSTVTA